MFATGKMRAIDAIDSDLGDKQGLASINLTRAPRSMWSIRSEIADPMISNTDAENSVVDLVASGRSRLSGGDLAHRIDERFPDGYEKLRSDFNAAMAKLQDTMRTVAASASAIRSGTGGISAASDDFSRRTEQQAASLEETAASWARSPPRRASRPPASTR